MGQYGKWMNISVMSESHTHTYTEKVPLMFSNRTPTSWSKSQATAKEYVFFYNNHRRCNYGARSPYARLISQNQLKISRWWICVKRKAHSASSAISRVHRDLHFDIIKNTVALNNNSNNYTFRKLWEPTKMFVAYLEILSVFRTQTS